MIGWRYTEQLAWKEQRVRELFADAGSDLALEVLPIVGSPRAFGYRNQAKLVLRRTRHGLLAGLYRAGTHQVIDVRACPVHDPEIQKALARIVPCLEAAEIPTYDERTGQGSLRYLIVRSSQAERALQVILVTATPLDEPLRRLLQRIARMRGVRSVVHDYNPHPGNVLLAYHFTPISARSELLERVGPFWLRVQAGTFLQANIAVAQRIYRYALEEARPASDGIAVDVFSGAGALSMYLATRARLVLGVEENPYAVADAKSNLRRNGFSNVRCFEGDASRVLPQLAERFQRAQVVALNPPRKGASEATLEAVCRLSPERIVYVSCSPETLLRDLTWLRDHGYRPLRLRPFDLMPQTDHVECVATIERIAPNSARARSEPPAPVSLAVDAKHSATNGSWSAASEAGLSRSPDRKKWES